jgi:hypothetical protein
MTDFELDRAALARLFKSDTAWLKDVGIKVRDLARANVPEDLKGNRAPNAEQAIVSVVGGDEQGPFVDVGYSRHHPGFYLWWYEVGTPDAAPRPHLRPALRPGLLDD